MGFEHWAEAMLGWINLDREQVREFARILVPGIAGLGLALVLLTLA
jgi:hypothetical protein